MVDVWGKGREKEEEKKSGRSVYLRESGGFTPVVGTLGNEKLSLVRDDRMVTWSRRRPSVRAPWNRVESR